MFLAVILPAAKKGQSSGGVVVCAMILGCVMRYTPVFGNLFRHADHHDHTDRCRGGGMAVPAKGTEKCRVISIFTYWSWRQ